MSWTDVVQALAAVVGAIATPAAVLLGVRSLRMQQEQHREAERRLQLTQPKAVNVDSIIREWPTTDGLGTYETVVATATNLGTETVYDVSLQWRLDAFAEAGESVFKGQLAPHERWQCAAPMTMVHLGRFEELGVFVTFYDSESRGWAKSQRGRLARLREAMNEGW